jgi:hypothetical protein
MRSPRKKMGHPNLTMRGFCRGQRSSPCALQDKYLLILTRQWLQADIEFAGLIYTHQLSVTIGQAVRDLELIAKVLDPQDIRNRIEFIPL